MMHPFERLAKEFPLIVRTPFHAQIKTESGYHDFWVGKAGFKAKLCGNKSVFYPDWDRLLKTLRDFKFEETDLAKLRVVERIVKKAKGKIGIFVDAGWKEGQARICVINMQKDTWQVNVVESAKETSIDAEKAAISLAMELYPTGIIYTDCQNLEEGRVVWIGRKKNEEADQFSNLRGIK